MLVNNDEIINHLLQYDLISKDRIIQRDLCIHEMPRRNSNFQVICENGPSYFIKHDNNNPEGELRFATIAYEAMVYEMFQKNIGKEFINCLPEFIHFDSKKNILVLQLIKDSSNLADYYFSKQYFPTRIAATLGKSLAFLHQTFRDSKNNSPQQDNIYKVLPPVFSLGEIAHSSYLNSSSANIEMMKILQSFDDFISGLEELKFLWKRETLIHGDMKWRNCLLIPNIISPAKHSIKIIDWELAVIGDAYWDIGTVFSEYLNYWISSITMFENSLTHSYPQSSDFLLNKIQSSVRSFWNSYHEYSNANNGETYNDLIRAIKFSAARLLQTTFEKLQFESDITNETVYTLQLCQNILVRPAEAAVRLLGLPLRVNYVE